MNNRQKWAIFALFIPLLALSGLTWDKHQRMVQGEEVLLPIVGFDPRDLLSGHYLTYQIEYGIQKLCTDQSSTQKSTPGYILLNPAEFSLWPPHPGRIFIKGACEKGRFKAGIERFYIPQEHATLLDKVVRGKQGKILLSVFFDGRAQVKNLLINDQPWQQFIADNTP
ncbi:MAG: GDYXXLXY domain-containing protein [Magnetococcales bacterium]|nr:GDYXXLXY domain-containing protein [Magnetococcales bacterium]